MNGLLVEQTRRTTGRVRRSLTATEQFEQMFDYRYPLFGCVARHRRVINPNRFADVAGWIVQKVRSEITTNNMRRILDLCQLQNPLWFDNVAFIRMGQPLHGLQPGIRLFVETQGFHQIPCSRVPRTERDKYATAILQEPDRSFSYLEPLWIVNAEGDRIGATVDDFIAFSRVQTYALRQAIITHQRRNAWRAVDSVIESAATYATIGAVYPFYLAFITLNRIRTGVADGLEFAKETALALREAATSHISLEALASRDPAVFAALHRYDPFIVFGAKELKSMFGDEIPLALVADWE